MDSIQIHRGNTIIHEFIPDSTFSRQWGLMSDNYIKFSLKAKENISLQFGDYILLKEEKFTLFSTVNVTETEGIKEYPLTFYGEQYFANRCIVEHEGATTFSYFGGVSEHMALVKLALDKYELSHFTLGTIEENGSQLIEYDNTKGLDAISKICEAFKMEWEFTGDIIHIKKRVGVDTSYRFEYGKGKGAYSVGLQPIQNTSIATRLIVKGGTTNLPHDYSSIDIPKRLNLGNEVLDRNTDKYGIIPEVMINEEIYPRLIDKKVVAVDVPADIENATTWKLKLDIPFDLAAQYAPDEKPEVKFQTGDLAGNSFEIVKNSWNNTDKTLQIIVLDQDGYKLPSQNRRPKVGDEFVLLNILMPSDPYITDATKELRKWGEEQLKIVSEPQFAPSLTASPQYIKANNIQLHPGDGIVVVAGGNEIHIRIQKITNDLSHEDRIDFELGNNTMYSYEQKITNDLNDITNEVQNIKKKVQNVDRRGWRDAKETNARLEGIEESAALIGTEGGQLVFTGTFQANVNSNPNSFLTTEGQLQHFIYKDTPAKGIWDIGSFNITLQEDALYSIYAKCDKERSNGIIYVSKEKIDIEAEEGYYYFFLGTISSIFEQARSITLVTGYTSITGGYLTGQVIQDARQRLIIDLPNATITAREGATIRGKVEIKSIDGEYKDAETVIDEKATASGSAAAQEKIDNLQIGGVNILKGSATGEGWKYWESHSGTEFSKQSSLGGEVFGFSDYIKIPGGTDIVVSFYAKNSGNVKLPLEFFILTDDYGVSGLLQSDYEPSAEWTYHSFTFKTPDTWGSGDSILPVRLRLDNNGSTDDQISTVYIKDVQIEYGNKATSYSIPEADREYIAKEEAARQVDGIQIGGVNLVDGSKSITVISAADNNWNHKNLAPLQSNTKYTLSIGSIVVNAGNPTEVQAFIYDETTLDYLSTPIRFIISNKRQSHTFTVPTFAEGHSVRLLIYTGIAGATAGNSITYNEVMLEYGNKATTWKPSEQDQKEQAENIANDKVNNIQIGGENIVSGTGTFTGETKPNYGGFGDLQSNTFRGNVVYQTTKDWQGFYFEEEPTTEPTIVSFYAKKISGNPYATSITNGDSSHRFNITSEYWKQYYFFFESGANLKNSTGHGVIEFAGGIVQYSSPKVEFGNKPTAWSPSVQDQKEQAENIANDKVNNIQIGDTNLLDGSNKGWKNSEYLTAVIPLGDYKPKKGEECTIVMKGKLGTGKECFGVHNSGGYIFLTNIYPAEFNAEGIAIKTFSWDIKDDGDSRISIYAMPNTVSAESEIEWVKLVSGNKTSLLWSPSLNDQKQQSTDIAKGEINNLQIGTVNLLNNSGHFTDNVKSWYTNGGGLEIDNSVLYNGFNTIKTNLGNGIHGDWYEIQPEVEYCYSVMLRSNVDIEGGGTSPVHIQTSPTQTGGHHETIVDYQQTAKANEWTLCYVVFKTLKDCRWFRPFIYGPNIGAQVNIAFLSLTKGNKPLTQWSPSLKDQKANIDKGRLFIRGTGHYRPADRMLIMNNDGVNRNEIQTEGLTLTVISRETFEILECITYDTLLASGQKMFIDKVKGLTDSVIVAITSCVSVTNGNSIAAFEKALAWCGGSGILPELGVPYALIGIPGIGKGNGLEVMTTAEPNAPYAEISVQVVNGVPQGMGSAAAILAQQAILKANELKFINKAFSGSDLDIGNGIIMSGALLVENAPGSKVASAGLAGYVPSGLPDNKTEYPMIFAGADGALKANEAEFRVYADGRTYIERGIIGGFKIDSTSFTNEGFDNDATLTFRNDRLHKFASIGGYTLPITSKIRPMCRLESHGADDYYENCGLYVSAQNSIKNHAIYMASGFISGFAINATWTSSNYQIDKECYITIYNSHSHPTITLPPEPSRGRTIFIKLMDTEWINIAASGGKKLNANGRPVSNANNWMRSWCTAMLVWDGQYWVYNLIGL